MNVAASGPCPKRAGWGFCSRRATAEAKIPIADSAGGKLECPGLPVTLNSIVAVPFSETPTLKQTVSLQKKLQQ